MMEKLIVVITMSLVGSTAYAGCVGYIESNNGMAVSLKTLETIKDATQSEPASCKPKLYKVKITGSPSGLGQNSDLACTKISTLFNQTWLMSSKTPLRHTNRLIHEMAAYQHKCPANGFFIRGYPVATGLKLQPLINLYTGHPND